MKSKDIPTKVLKPRASNHEAAITSFMALLEVIPETWANFITLLLQQAALDTWRQPAHVRLRAPCP